jgi:CheY-like chemotaxis protein
MPAILVLEDERTVMSVLTRALKGYTILPAASAEEAICCFHAAQHRIDLLIADLSLPKSSGVQVALLLRSELPGLPVILASGYPANAWSERDSTDLARLGSNRVMIFQKPFQLRLILDAVRQLTEERKVLTAPSA